METIIAIGFWIFLLVIARQLINKSYDHTIRISDMDESYMDEFIEELSVLYEVGESGGDIILKSPKFNDPITEGELIINKRSINHKGIIPIEYKRQIKGVGYIIIIISLLFCYIGVIVPIIMVKQNKKNVLSEIEKIRSLARSIQ